MSDPLKHECGIALVRLLKPFEYYYEKYGTALYGFNKLFLLLEKQHNRGQDGAGIGCVKLGMPVGEHYMFRDRCTESNSLSRLVRNQQRQYHELHSRGLIDEGDPSRLKRNWDFGGELLMGHLRYGTSGSYGSGVCHPYVRRSNWPTRNLMLAGNFNMTNAGALHEELISRGQHPILDTDTQVILEAIGYQLDEEHTRIYRELRDEGLQGIEIQSRISELLDPAAILRPAARNWDGGYVIGGLIGNGDSFVLRDPLGIRPAYYYADEEIIAVTSERVPLMTILGLEKEEIRQIRPGHALVIKNSGEYREEAYREEVKPHKHCSFERIYFSRGNDPHIYRERKALGAALADPIMEVIGEDFDNTIFSYIPNTAETAYIGLMDELHRRRRQEVKQRILEAGEVTEALLEGLIMGNWPRSEKIAIKDIKLRTFISQEEDRMQLASHVYDVSYGVVRNTDTLVCIDDSIVRGTTLRQSILKILARLNPKRIVVASTAPQIRYPDCYGIDMSQIGKFIAFQSVVELLKEEGNDWMLGEVYEACLAQRDYEPGEMVNHVKRLYDAYSDEEISRKIAQKVFPSGFGWSGEVDMIYQKVESLHDCLIQESGDWYFTGDYPTPGGFSVLNQSFINYYEGVDARSYAMEGV